MKLRRSRAESAIFINVTSLVDLLLLLIIFFMVSTTFISDSAVSLTLPEATQKAQPREPKTIEVQIDQQGHFFVQGKALSNEHRETVKSALSVAAEGQDKPRIVIKADQNTAYQGVVTIMDAAKQLGLLHITFAARPVDSDS
jgi:biopolymer transport protein ExbD